MGSVTLRFYCRQVDSCLYWTTLKSPTPVTASNMTNGNPTQAHLGWMVAPSLQKIEETLPGTVALRHSSSCPEVAGSDRVYMATRVPVWIRDPTSTLRDVTLAGTDTGRKMSCRFLSAMMRNPLNKEVVTTYAQI